MQALKPTGNPDCDDIINWLDRRSVSVRQGLPAQVLHTRWAQAGRPPGALGTALQQLFRDDWIVLTPELEPEHLRFTVEGYRRLVGMPLAANQASAEELHSALDEPQPETPKMRASDQSQSAVPPPQQASQPTEISLRNDILAVYRRLNLKADNRLIGMTLMRYWQESGHRASDLRGGIDVLLRDGYLEQRLVGIDRHWMLTADGAFFIRSPLTPETLVRLAPPLDLVDAAPPPVELRRIVARALVSQGYTASDTIDYRAVRPEWMKQTRLDDNALLHGLDLLHKSGYLSIGEGEQGEIVLTRKGYDLGSQGEIARLFTKLSRSLN